MAAERAPRLEGRASADACGLRCRAPCGRLRASTGNSRSRCSRAFRCSRAAPISTPRKSWRPSSAGACRLPSGSRFPSRLSTTITTRYAARSPGTGPLGSADHAGQRRAGRHIWSRALGGASDDGLVAPARRVYLPREGSRDRAGQQRSQRRYRRERRSRRIRRWCSPRWICRAASSSTPWCAMSTSCRCRECRSYVDARCAARVAARARISRSRSSAEPARRAASGIPAYLAQPPRHRAQPLRQDHVAVLRALAHRLAGDGDAGRRRRTRARRIPGQGGVPLQLRAVRRVAGGGVCDCRRALHDLRAGRRSVRRRSWMRPCRARACRAIRSPCSAIARPKRSAPARSCSSAHPSCAQLDEILSRARRAARCSP